MNNYLLDFFTYSVIFLILPIIFFIVVIEMRKRVSYKLTIKDGYVTESSYKSNNRSVDISSIKVINYRPYFVPGTTGVINIPHFEGDFDFKGPFPACPVNLVVINKIIEANPLIEFKKELAEPWASSPQAVLYDVSKASLITKILLVVMVITVSAALIWSFISKLFS